MLEHHSHLLTGSIDVDKIVIVNLLHRHLVFLALCGGELLLQKILSLDLGYSRIRIHTACNKLFVGIGSHNNLGVEIRINRIEKLILQPYLTKGRLAQQIHTTKKGGFTASGRSDNCNHLTLFNMAVNTLENGYAVFECFNYILNAYHLGATSFL